MPTKVFTSLGTKHAINIRQKNRNYASENGVELISGQTCQKLFDRSSEKFNSRFIIITGGQIVSSKKKKTWKLEPFHADFTGGYGQSDCVLR